MEEDLQKGTTLVLDRYAFSGVAFTAAKVCPTVDAKDCPGANDDPTVTDTWPHCCRALAQGLDLEWCKAPDAGLPAPDLTIFLDIPVDAAAERGDFGEVCMCVSDPVMLA